MFLYIPFVFCQPCKLNQYLIVMFIVMFSSVINYCAWRGLTRKLSGPENKVVERNLSANCWGVITALYSLTFEKIMPVISRYIQALLLLVELLHYCALIGRELQSDEIFSEWCYASSLICGFHAQKESIIGRPYAKPRYSSPPKYFWLKTGRFRLKLSINIFIDSKPSQTRHTSVIKVYNVGARKRSYNMNI